MSQKVITRFKNALLLLTCLTVIILSLTGCVHRNATSSENGTITYVDLAGKTVHIKKDVERIILLRSRDIYELSALLGNDVPNKLVGWGPDLNNNDNDGYTKFTDKFPSLKHIANTGDVQSDAVDLETVISLKPDLIIADKYMLGEYKSVDKLEEAGLPVVCLDQSSDPLASPQKGMLLLGKILDKEDRANQIVDYVNSQIDEVYQKLSKVSGSEPSIYLECGDEGPAIFSDTYGGANDQSWGSILSRLRVKNIADGVVPGMAPINPELIIKADPDIIVITGQHWTAHSDSMRLGFFANKNESEELLAAFTTRPGWSQLSAVKNRRVYSVFHNLSMHIYDFMGLQALAKDIYPERFNDVDPEQNLKIFFDKFMPISYTGKFSLTLGE